MISLNVVKENSFRLFCHFSIVIFIAVLSVFTINGCTESMSNGLSGELYHPEDWGDDPQHGKDFQNDADNCKACHGEGLNGGQADSSCIYCHHKNEWNATTHGIEYANSSDTCKGCHKEDLEGTDTVASCASCHDNPN